MTTADENLRRPRQVWALRLAITGLSLSALAHLAASPQVVEEYAASNLDDTTRREATVIWFLSVVTFASLPAALAWSTRLPVQAARPVQAYAALLTGGVAAASVPVALTGRGLTGLLTMPQPLVAAAFTVLIAAGRARGGAAGCSSGVSRRARG